MDSARTDDIIKFDREHILHPLLQVGQNIGVIFEYGHGIKLKDTRGKEYFDVASQLLNVNLGYGRREMLDAIVKQTEKLQFATLFLGYSNTAAIECSSRLAEVVPAGLDHFTFTTGGSEANEAAFKIARSYWRNKGENKHKIISLSNSYHGATHATLSATGQPGLWPPIGSIMPGFIHMPPPYCYRCSFNLQYPSCDIKCAEFLARVIEQEGVENVAAFIAEPIQGAGGSITPPLEYWPIIKKICKEYEVLLIADEVITAFGRTGKFFGLQHWGVKPDIMTMSKGITSAYLPLGAVAIDQDIWRNLESGPPFGISFSGGGNPICCAAAAKAIELYLEDKIAENAAKVGEHVIERLKTEFEPLPCVGTIHGKGLMLAVELVENKDSKVPLLVEEQLRQQGRENGLILRIVGRNKLGFNPPLIITLEEADKILDILHPIVAALKSR